MQVWVYNNSSAHFQVVFCENCPMCMCVLDVFVVVFCENSSMCICVLDVFVGEGELPVLLSCHLDPISSDSLLNFPSVHACFSPSTVHNLVY